MNSSVFKHTIFINITNRVVRHLVDELTGKQAEEVKNLSDEEKYVVSYGKSSEMFRIVYYSDDDSRYKTEKEILKTFRSRCSQGESAQKVNV